MDNAGMIPAIGTDGLYLNPAILEKGPNQKIVVTGCARSGTRFMKLLLNSPDIKSQVGHERIYAGGIVSWMAAHAIQSDDILKAFAGYDTKWIHITRNPIKVIQSISRLHVDPRGRISYQPFLAQFPKYKKSVFADNPHMLGVFNWIEWNLLIPQIFPIDITISVEELNDGKVEKLAALLDIPDSILKSNIKRLGKEQHTHPKHWEESMDSRLGDQFSMDWLHKQNATIAGCLIEIANQFGYILE